MTNIERTTTCSTEFQDKVEALIDRSTLYDVLEAIATVCHAKSDHIGSNWQDDATAKVWETAANQVNALIARSRAIRSI